VANTGIPFSPEGVKSLMVSDNSPKQLKGHCIGYKGLGFRSVLGWTSFAVILSGKVSIAFSEKKARNWLKELISRNEKVKKKVEEADKKGLKNPIATLSIPYFLDLNAPSQFPIQEMHQIISELGGAGYDTIICLVFKSSQETFERVQNQIKSVKREILLFLQHLGRIEILDGSNQTVWNVERKTREVVIDSDNADRQVWRLFDDSGEIPQKYRRPEQPLATKYEIKLATSQGISETQNLFVYFPTEVSFPFPLIAHATFELTDNRQHLIESDINRFVAAKLSALIANFAETLVDSSHPWRALECVTPRGDIDSVLVKLGFKEDLKRQIVTRKIIPVRLNKFESADNAKLIPGDFDTLLVGEEFQEVTLYTENEFLETELEELEVKPLKYDDLRERLNKLSKTEMTNDKRAEIIYRLVDSEILMKDSPPPAILTDENGSVIPADSKIFLPPEGKIFSLPSWVPHRILNSELAGKLKEKFDKRGVRELAFELRAFGVQAYSMATLVSVIVAETNKLVREHPGRELESRKEMIRTLWELYSAQKKEEIPVFPDDAKIVLPTRDGSFQPARALYPGHEYPGGDLMEYLYGALGVPFIANPVELSLQGNIDEIKMFLCWLGVSDIPRIVKTESVCEEFLDYVLENLQYPAKFGDMIVDSKDEAKTMYPKLSNVDTVDRLEEMLEKADPHAVIAWIVRINEKLDSLRVSGDSEATLEIHPSAKWYSRKLDNGVIPSYIMWILGTKKWLPLSNHEKQSPSMCTLAKGTSKEVSAIVGYPFLNSEHPLLKSLKIDRTKLRNALATIGVVAELDELSWDSFYQILLQLPQKDPEGKLARSVYRTLIARTEYGQPSGEKYERFMKEGKMFGYIGGKPSYFPISDLHYFENPTLPASVLRLIPSLDLDRRRGAIKVRTLFGVKPFTLADAKITMNNFEEHPYSKEFQNEVEVLKPFIYALRAEEDSDRSEFKSLMALQIKLCRSAQFSLEISETEKEIVLQPGESIIVDSTVYIVVEQIEYDQPLIRDEIIADALGDVITSKLKVEIGSDIARLATCSNNRRNALLDKISGGSGETRLKEVEELIKSPSANFEEEFTAHIPLTPSSPTIELTSPTQQVEDEQSEDTSTRDRNEFVGPVSVSGGNHVEVSPPREITRRVTFSSTPGGGGAPRAQINPDRAENLVVEFEKAQGRFPEKVSHLQGSEAYGVDVLSFNKKEDLESFYSKPDLNLIERFIEVKGRVSSSGSIILHGNEMKCAQKEGRRFFLYRVYETERTGEFELVETQDPLGIETSALKVQYEVHPFRTRSSKHWAVKEIDNENS
jgi:hypothetical protein